MIISTRETNLGRLTTPFARTNPTAQPRQPRSATAQLPYEVALYYTKASLTCWRLSPPPRHPPVSSGLLVHPRIPSLLLVPVTRRFHPLQTPHRWEHLHLRPLPSGKVDASARTWSQNQQVSCMCSYGLCRSTFTHSPSQPPRTCLRCGSSSRTPHTVGSGRPG